MLEIDLTYGQLQRLLRGERLQFGELVLRNIDQEEGSDESI